MQAIKRFALGYLILSTAGCGILTDSAETRARQVLSLVLKDPESAQFSDVDEKNGVICGFVNSRNSMGAYSGISPFIIQNGSADILDGADPGFIKKFGDLCTYSQVDKLVAFESQKTQDFVKKLNAPNP